MKKALQQPNGNKMHAVLLLFVVPSTQAWLSANPSSAQLPSRFITRLWDEDMKGGRRQSIREPVTNVYSSGNRTSTNEGLSEPTLSEFQLTILKTENEILRNTVRQLELENERLRHNSPTIVIETFEGEGQLPSPYLSHSSLPDYGVSEIDYSTQWCDELNGQGTCPLEPTVSFRSAVKDRALWLVGLLAFQSCSGFILSRNEALLEQHPTIIYFLTMLVGAGGNAGNQASVRVIRGLALGTLNNTTQPQFLLRELNMAGALCVIISFAGFFRAAAFRTPLPETIAVTSALAMIVFSSICLGAVLPLVLKKLGVDPAHSSTTIQVMMDILGVVLTVVVSGAVLDSAIGQRLVSRLTGGL